MLSDATATDGRNLWWIFQAVSWPIAIFEPPLEIPGGRLITLNPSEGGLCSRDYRQDLKPGAILTIDDETDTDECWSKFWGPCQGAWFDWHSVYDCWLFVPAWRQWIVLCPSMLLLASDQGFLQRVSPNARRTTYHQNPHPTYSLQKQKFSETQNKATWHRCFPLAEKSPFPPKLYRILRSSWNKTRHGLKIDTKSLQTAQTGFDPWTKWPNWARFYLTDIWELSRPLTLFHSP